MRRGTGPEGGPRPLHRPGKGVERGGCVLLRRTRLLGCHGEDPLRLAVRVGSLLFQPCRMLR